MAVRVQDTIFSLDGDNSSYVFCLDDKQYLRHLHWGKPISNLSDFTPSSVERIDSQDAAIDVMSEEYASFGGLRYKSTAIKSLFADGTRDMVFTFLRHTIKDNTLIIHLKDAYYKVFVNLFYKIHEEHDILERWVEVENKEKSDVVLEEIASASFNLFGTHFSSTQVFGHFASEQNYFREKLYPGKKVFESRKGVTGNNHSPVFILDQYATEDIGEVYFGVLAYSGNFAVTIETTQFQSTRILLGINPFDFSYRLRPGETFTTPSVFAGYTQKGFSDMSNKMNNFYRDVLVKPSKRKMIQPVLYNSWEATKFDISVSQQIALARKAASLGVELFVLDDGWFGERNGDTAGLGDWFPNKKKFPRGLSELVNEVNNLGMDFGLWIEPEAVNPDSDLYREHPDWIYHFPHRERTMNRNQCVLNFTRKDVQEYIFAVIDKLLLENNISYIKWDMNRPISEPGAVNLENADQRSMWYLHVLAVYDIVDRLKKKHPKVTFEACASGGSRTDYGMLLHFDQFWISDNTDAHDRLLIQEGYSFLYPISAMRAWVTDVPNKITKKTTPLEFRFHSAMMGTLGLGGNLTKYSQEELDIARRKVTEYKKIRHIVQNGEVYRIASIRNNPLHAVQHVLNKEESVLFIFLPRQEYIHKNFLVELKGLDPKKMYSISGIDRNYKKRGDYLMYVGLEFKLMGDYISEIVSLKAV